MREPDLNRRPSGYEPDELPDCSIPRLCGGILQRIAGLSTDQVKKTVLVQLLSLKKQPLNRPRGHAAQGFQLY
ncbi:hypothetical protein EMIT0373P_50568 [Pseudomonas chlororaphis]